MHGHAFSEFDHFYDKWKLVTTRFRRDTNELRFVYANDLAWNTLEANKTEFPDGAVLGKIAYTTQEDPRFVSSMVPSGTKRYQFMIRDQKKFADTGGWGYLLFNSHGQTFPEDPVNTSKACAACHNIVSDRGYVFSEIVHVNPFEISRHESTKAPPRIQFSNLAASRLGRELRRLLPASTTTVRAVEGELRRSLFEGTLNEIRPTLTLEAVKNGRPAILVSENGEEFSYAYANPKATKCGKGAVSISYGMTSPNLASAAGSSERILKMGSFCYAKNEPSIRPTTD